MGASLLCEHSSVTLKGILTNKGTVKTRFMRHGHKQFQSPLLVQSLTSLRKSHLEFFILVLPNWLSYMVLGCLPGLFEVFLEGGAVCR